MKRNILIALLLITAFFFRVYAIGTTAEFLGDQGRDGLALLTAMSEKKFPITGPTVGAGYFTGPFYYYLIAPSYLLFPTTPVAPIIEMCFITVAAIVLFLYVATQLFGFQIAYVVSFFWALSPVMIMQDRRLWNPTPIPFFILLLITSMLLVFRHKKYIGYITAAIAVAALIQLHYVNAISLVFCCCIWFGLEIQQIRKKQTPIPYVWMISAIVTVAILLSPFLLYETQHAFRNVSGSIATFFHGKETLFSKRAYVIAFGDIAASLWTYVIAIRMKGLLLVLATVAVLINVARKKIEPVLLSMWFCFGISMLAFYRDKIQPQYWYQLIPIVFLLLSGMLSSIHKRTVVIMSILIVTVAGCVSWVSVHPYAIEDPDLPRMIRITEKVPAFVDGKRFAFTVIHSRSFNDLHMRYFFTLYGIPFVSMDDTTNNQLLIVCENECLEKPNEKKISIMCSTEICPLDKPTIPFDVWTYEKTEMAGNSALYLYTR